MTGAPLFGLEAAALDAPNPAALSLRETVEAFFGPTTFIDLSFPRSLSLFNRTIRGKQMLLTHYSQFERDFFLRFRQSGGHLPIAIGDQAAQIPVEQDLNGGEVENFIAFLDEEAMSGTPLPDFLADCSILVPLQSGRKASTTMRRCDKRITLAAADQSRAYQLLIPTQHSAHASGGISRRDATEITFDEGGRDIVIDASALIHDGGYLSEGDDKYSWLWTGPSPHFRMILPLSAVTAEICVSRVEDPHNLDKLDVQINGRPATFDFDRWSEASGKIRIELPLRTDFTVVTMIAPKPTLDGNSKRLLGLCVDKVILTS